MTEQLNTAQNRNRLMDSQNKLKLGHGKDGGKGESGSLGWTCTHCYTENGWITNKDLLCSTWNSAQYYVAAQMGGKSGGEWIHVYVWLNPFALHLKLSQLCCVVGNASLVQSLWKTVRQFLGRYLNKTKIQKKYVHPSVHSNTIHNIQCMETT